MRTAVYPQLTRRQAENHPRVQQVIDRRTRRHVAFGLLIPVTQQLAFLAGEQAVAQALIVIAPVGGFVHQFLSRRGDLAVFDQPHLDFVNATGQRPGVKGLQAGCDGLGVDQHAVAKDLHRRLTVRRDIDRINAGCRAVDRQAVGTAVHQAHRCIGAGAE